MSRGMTKRYGSRRIGAWSCEIRSVEEIEELRPELGGIAFPELPELSDGEIHVPIAWTGEEARMRVTEGSVSGRSQNASTL